MAQFPQLWKKETDVCKGSKYADSLCSSRSNPQVSFPGLQQNTCCSLPHLQWIPQVLPPPPPQSPSPHSLHCPRPQFKQALLGIHRPIWPWKQVDWLKIFTFPSTPPSPIPKTHLQLCSRPSAVASPHSLTQFPGNQHILEKNPTTSLFLSVSSNTKVHIYLKPPVATLSGLQTTQNHHTRLKIREETEAVLVRVLLLWKDTMTMTNLIKNNI
jgi:hypothetical protein